jgi:signal transduction histidine kinase
MGRPLRVIMYEIILRELVESLEVSGAIVIQVYGSGNKVVGRYGVPISIDMLGVEGRSAYLYTHIKVANIDWGYLITPVPKGEVDKERYLSAAVRLLSDAVIEDALEGVERLTSISERLEDFTRIASHDLQEPLRTITSFLGLLKKRHGAELSPQALHYLDTAVNSSKRMGELLSDLLVYSRMGSKTKSFERVPLSEVVMKAMGNISGKLVTEVCPTMVYEPSSFPTVWGDSVQLVTCVQNLLTNAIKFGGGAPIEISHRETDTHWELRVIDRGIGIPKGMEESIFKPFKRAHLEYAGTGMGLAIVEKVASMHGGRAWASTTEGGGTTVHFTIRKPQL